MTKKKEIVIVGAGLVGSLMANYLARRDYQVTVLERRPDLRLQTIDGGRSINLALSNRGLRALAEVELAERVRASAVPMHGRMMHDVAGGLSFQRYGTDGQFINSISRAGLNAMLITEAENSGVKFLFGHRVQAVDLSRTALQIEDGSDRWMSSDVIIGADGNFSAVRGAMQFTDRFDFSQSYIEHGYKEFNIPAGADGQYVMEKNALHIWPRENFMLIALPNPDGSFTATLFFPFEGPLSFSTLSREKEFLDFFNQTFPDAVPVMPGLIDDHRDHPAATLITIQCYPWHVNRTLLIGDAAHGILPFYGQGMNAGFEDCRILNKLLVEGGDDWESVLPAFQGLRKPDTDAIAQLAMDNFVEMRDHVADEEFLLRKRIEAKIHEQFPTQWIPLYSMVTFHDEIEYATARDLGEKQRRIMDEVMLRPDISTTWQSLELRQLVDRLQGT
jgi:kynurenine 3-monooxygenase